MVKIAEIVKKIAPSFLVTNDYEDDEEYEDYRARLSGEQETFRQVEDVQDFPFVKGKISYNFDIIEIDTERMRPNKAIYKRPLFISGGKYEEGLINFFETAAKDLYQKGRLVAVIGGTGAGKSTAIRYVKKYVDSNYDGTVASNYIDFNNWNERASTDGHASVDEENRQLWASIAVRFSIIPLEYFDVSREIKELWPWLQRRRSFLSNIPSINSFFLAMIEKIKSCAANEGYADRNHESLFNDLTKEREKLILKFTPQELAWYYIAKYFYYETIVRSSGTPVFIFDNVDHADPWAQKTIYAMLRTIVSELGVYVLVVMRPHTINTYFGNVIVERFPHKSPDIVDVILERLNFAENQEYCADIKREINLIKHILNEENEGHSWLLIKLLRATSGINCRAGIRNFLNFLASPIISNLDASELVNSTFGIDTSMFARSFLYGTSNSMDPDNIVNLYQRFNSSTGADSWISFRTLDFVARVRGGQTDLYDVIRFLRNFGYTNSSIYSCFRLLTLRRRSLVWCEKDFHINENTADQRIRISPIGIAYLSELSGEYFYFETCRVNGLYERIYGDTLRVLFDEMIERDMAEIEIYVQNCGQESYLSLYPDSICCMSLLHWTTFDRGLMQRKVEYDTAKENNIRDKVSRILRETDMISGAEITE